MRPGPVDDDQTYFTTFLHKFAAICTDTTRTEPEPPDCLAAPPVI